MVVVAVLGGALAACVGGNPPCLRTVMCGPCPPPITVQIAAPAGRPTPAIEIRGIEAVCGEDGMGITCSVGAEQSSYAFEIVAQGYQTIQVSHELRGSDCGGACCCCGYEPVILHFELVPLSP